MENKDLYLNIKNEINYLVKVNNKILNTTKYDSKEHLIALGEIMALNDLIYSVSNDNWLYKKEEIEVI